MDGTCPSACADAFCFRGMRRVDDQHEQIRRRADPCRKSITRARPARDDWQDTGHAREDG
jgi:hypothetical protein